VVGWFTEHDMGFKRLVYQKMKDLGYELDMAEVEAAHPRPKLGASAIDGEVGDALRDERSRLAAELAGVYSKSDELIAAVMADQSLSEEERRAKCAQIEAEAKARASALFIEQKQMKAREAALEAQLATYGAKVSEAAAAAKAAAEAGILSPQAMNITKNLEDAGGHIATMRAHPLFATGLVEVGSKGEVRHAGNSLSEEKVIALEKANAQLKRETDHLESEVETLHQKLHM